MSRSVRVESEAGPRGGNASETARTMGSVSAMARGGRSGGAGEVVTEATSVAGTISAKARHPDDHGVALADRSVCGELPRRGVLNERTDAYPTPNPSPTTLLELQNDSALPHHSARYSS